MPTRPFAFFAVLVVLGLSFGVLFGGCAAAFEDEDNAPRDYPPSVSPDRIVLTWSDDPSTTQAVTWRTDTSVTEAYAQVVRAEDYAPILEGDELDYDLSDEQLPPPVSPEPTRAETTTLEWYDRTDHYHSVVFTGLEPGTRYTYRVGGNGEWSEWNDFTTASTEPEPFTFLYFGDAQNNIFEYWPRTLRTAVRHDPDIRFMVHAGDLTLSSGGDYSWGDWHAGGGWAHATVPSIPSAGNSDHYRWREDPIDTRRLFPQWRAGFTLPQNGPDALHELAYYVDFQDARIISLYSNFESVRDDREIYVSESQEITMEVAEQQAEWLEEVLRDHEQKWTFVVFHHPVFTAREERYNERLEAFFRPLFTEYGVDLVLQGHDHTYARGQDPDLEVPEGRTGPMYTVSNAGAKMRPLHRDYDWIQRAGENVQLYHPITVSGDTLHFDAYTATGEYYDGFTIIKAEDGGFNHFEDRAPDTPERRFDGEEVVTAN